VADSETHVYSGIDDRNRRSNLFIVVITASTVPNFNLKQLFIVYD
jgi:hypothetical protein